VEPLRLGGFYASEDRPKCHADNAGLVRRRAAKLRIQTFRGRNMLAATLLMMVEHVLTEAMRQPGHTVRAELATLDWEGRRRPAVVLGCWDGTSSRRVAIFETGAAGISHVELLLDGGLDLEMSGVVPL
jgi:hypothetical protein